MGKLLKNAMMPYDPKNNIDKLSLYHGITEQLNFPAYLHCNIRVPLSTTTEFMVARNFANSDRGLIVEFDYGEDGVSKSFRFPGDLRRYFRVSWLSDFPYEKEYLFLGLGKNWDLYYSSWTIKNVWNIDDGEQYAELMQFICYVGDRNWAIPKYFGDHLYRMQI